MVQSLKTYGYFFGIACVLSFSGLCYFFYFSRHATKIDLLKSKSGRKLYLINNYLEDEAKVPVGPTNDTTDTNERKIFPVVLFNVQPKSGSRTLYELVKKLSNYTGKNIIIQNTMGGYSQSFFDKVRDIRKLVHSNEMGFLYTHMRYQEFEKVKYPPRYISIVRDPVDRLSSLYYFVRYGDNIEEDESEAGREFREKMKTMNFSNETFDECVLKGRLSCRDSWAIVRHFCGYDKKICLKTAKSKAYAKAVNNINKQYVVVGIMEDYLSTLKILEKLIPEIFEGVVDLYKEDKKAIMGKMRTKNKTSISVRTRNVLRKEMSEDYKLYNYIKQTFKLTKKRLGIV